MYLTKAGLVLALGLFIGDCGPTTPNTKSNPNANQTSSSAPALKISYPAADSKVEMKEVVRGTSQNIPAGQKIWVAIYNQAVSRYYPQDNQADVQAYGNWAGATAFGIPQDKGKDLKFDVLAVTVDKNAEAEFEKYLSQARGTNDYPGLQQLPPGTTIYDRLTVTRK